jgi:ribosome-binding factor A
MQRCLLEHRTGWQGIRTALHPRCRQLAHGVIIMSKFRKHRVAGLLREVISDIVLHKIKDPRVQDVTITEVRLSNDLKSARVYFGCLAATDPDLRKQGLESALGFIRRELRRELDLKYIPELTFSYDTSFDYSSRINRILKDLNISSSDDHE